jgi:hypothetical protein
MKTNIERGQRKVAVARQSGLFLLAGLVIVCAAAYFCGLNLKDAAPLFFTFAAGITGKDTAFMWGNSKEHEAAATSPPAAPSP